MPDWFIPFARTEDGLIAIVYSHFIGRGTSTKTTCAAIWCPRCGKVRFWKDAHECTHDQSTIVINGVI